MPSSSKTGKHKARPTEIIDVDEYAQKFEPLPTDIISLDAKDFRQSVREGKRKATHASSIGEAIKTARALHGPPASKRQKINPPPPLSSIPHRTFSEHRETRSPSASSSSGRVKAVKRSVITLEIPDSDDEGVEPLPQGPPPKKPRTIAPRLSQSVNRPAKAFCKPDIIELSDGSDSDAEPVDDGFDWDPPGWDLNDEDKWTPLRVNPDRVENLAASLEATTINSSSPLVTPLLPQIDNTTRFRSNLVARSHQQRAPQYVWEMFPAAFQPRLRPRFMELPMQPIIRTWKEVYQPLFSSRCLNKFKQSPGAIHNVQQKGQWTVVTSGCIGGEPDTEGEDRSPYNHSGGLITYDKHTRRVEIPVGHFKQKSNPDETWTKNYALHDAQFDPLCDMFVSSGADRKVLFWGLAQDDDTELSVQSEIFGTNPDSCWRKKDERSFRYPPNQVSFKPVCSDDEVSYVAIAERRIHIFSLTDQEMPQKEMDFRLFSKRNQPHIVGTMVWGRGPTADCLFASSEPDPLISRDDIPQALFTGRHRAFNIEGQEVLYDLQAEEAGDSLCINPSGTTIALTTLCTEDHSILRLFDVGHKDKRPTSSINVNPYPTAKDRGFEKYEGEVTSTAFSPDGVFLAIGRNDNTVHVYDTRYLDKGPLYQLEHHGECRSAGKEKYGIAKVEWLHSQQTRRIALATAGEDGCVRLWNPLKAMDEENGQVIAEVNSDIGYFSIGDPYKGENRLVVGDLSGHVSFFDLEP